MSIIMSPYSLYMITSLFFFFLLQPPICSARSEVYQFTFPQFTYPGYEETIGVYGDIQYSKDSHSWVMNVNSATTSTGSCAQLTYTGEPNLHIQDPATGKMASFSTSFTFKFSTPLNQQVYNLTESDEITSRVETGISLILSKSSAFQSSMYDRNYWTSQPGACIWSPSENYNTIVFRSVYNKDRNIPSNNYIGVIDGASKNRVFKANSTYNLCGNRTHCSFYSSGNSFTAWIDFTPDRSLEVRLRNGSHSHTDKPLTSLLDVPNYTLPTGEGDYLSFTFLGSSGENQVYQKHEILSWRFYSNGLPLPSKNKPWVRVVLGVGCGVATLFIVGCVLFRFVLRRQFVVASLYPIQPRAFSYKELRIATKNFSESEKLGSGGYGTVYKGSFRGSSNHGVDNVILAVKRINYESKHAEKTFEAEVSSLGHIKHRNIVELKGWCHEIGRLLLVYDYMPNGSLNEWLYDSSGSSGKYRAPLSWRIRHSILSEVATALEYLHKNCTQCVLHRDIKSSNIMLDADFKAHLGDFGLARLMDHERLDKTTMAAGTIGYMAPEVTYTGKATKESDVYSFGILMLEVVCGTSPLHLNAHKFGVSTLDLEDDILLHKVWRAYESGRYISVADPRLLRTCCQHCQLQLGNNQDKRLAIATHSSTLNNLSNRSIDDNISHVEVTKIDENEMLEGIMVKSLLHLGLLCCLPSPKSRPTIEQVIGFLQQIGCKDNVGLDTTTMPNLPPLPQTNPIK